MGFSYALKRRGRREEGEEKISHEEERRRAGPPPSSSWKVEEEPTSKPSPWPSPSASARRGYFPDQVSYISRFRAECIDNGYTMDEIDAAVLLGTETYYRNLPMI